ncbi:MAG: 50S ribosomal protein L18e [Candidatus Woesearchaeota archaeon]
MQIRPKNEIYKRTIEMLRQASYAGNPVWKKVADDLNVPTRKKKVVNLSKLNRLTSENEVVVVPGKVLASGEIEHKITIAALNFSKEAIEKLKRAGAQILSIEELLKKNPEGKEIKVIG